MRTRDINTAERREMRCVSPLWPLGPPILGGSRSFSRFPPLSHITRAWSHTGLCVCHDVMLVMPRCILVPRDTRPVSPASDDEPPGTDIMAPDTRDVLKSARGHNECLRACVSPPDIIVTPLFAPLTLRLPNIEAGKYLKASSPLSVNNNKTLFLTEGPTFTVFLHGYWKVFICMIGSSPAHYWEKSSWLVPGRVTIIQSLSQSRAPRVSVSSQNSHNIIQLGVKTPAPGTMAHREPVQTIHSHVNLNTWQTWNATHNTQHTTQHTTQRRWQKLT